MAIQREVWVQDIVENLFPSNLFSNYATNHDGFVVEGRVVHQPYAGAKPTVVKDRTTLPATVTTRVDLDLTYTLAEYSTDPVTLRNAEKFELSYDKRMSLLGEHIAALRDRIHADLLQAWLGTASALGALPSGNLIATSGVLENGKRKLALADLLRVKQEMDRRNIPDEGRYLLFPAELHNELFSIDEVVQAELLGRATLPEGVVSQLLGFNILKRGSTVVYDGAGALRPFGAVPAPTDRLAVVAWSRYSVARALGEVNLYESTDDPLYYGDIYSASVRAGGTRLRNDGVYALLQATS